MPTAASRDRFHNTPSTHPAPQNHPYTHWARDLYRRSTISLDPTTRQHRSRRALIKSTLIRSVIVLIVLAIVLAVVLTNTTFKPGGKLETAHIVVLVLSGVVISYLAVGIGRMLVAMRRQSRMEGEQQLQRQSASSVRLSRNTTTSTMVSIIRAPVSRETGATSGGASISREFGVGGATHRPDTVVSGAAIRLSSMSASSAAV